MVEHVHQGHQHAHTHSARWAGCAEGAGVHNLRRGGIELVGVR